MSIGEVLAALRPEFPDVTISKIRFLEEQGLVDPDRTPSGYRKFGHDDVERLRFILSVQRDHYLPLRVIREHLDAMDAGEAPPEPPGTEHAAAVDVPSATEQLVRDAFVPGPRLGRAELLAAAGVAEQQLADWESYGLVAATPDGGFDPEMLQVARLVAELGRFGLEPRHLRAVKAAADREVGLVEQIVAPLRRHRNPQTRAHAAALARELATLSVRLHAALVHAGLRAHPGV